MQQSVFRQLVISLGLAAFVVALSGCGTTRRTDTARTATEQMLLSDAIDRAVSRIDFGLLAGKPVFFDTTYLGSTVDKDYLISTLRQHMLACGCVLRDKKDDALLIVEVRAGTIGTDRHDLLFGTPATSVSLGGLSPVGAPTSVPEIALAKRTDQLGVAKIGVFAYERESGQPVWQSGSDVVASRSRDLWVFGTGPFQRGTIYDRTQFAGDELRVPLVSGSNTDKRPPVRVARERVFNSNIGNRDGKEGASSTAGKSGNNNEQVADTKSDKNDAKKNSGDGAGFVSPAAFEYLSPFDRKVEDRAVRSDDVKKLSDRHAEGKSEPALLPREPSTAVRSQFDSVWQPTAAELKADSRWPAASNREPRN